MKESYLPLYRKYRPQKLEDVVGQAHIKTALKNAIELDKISHAYLFTGPRGTGKTSTARILAKSLNCVNGPTLSPCGECESCKSVTNSVPIDVIEIDAASNRSVEDAHNILEKVQYAPVQGKHKIYIIDEVHMLTPQAFNALLKTLEEPPKNVVFILATTESHKVLDTIKSRCQRFDFKRITTSDIVEHLKKIAELEKINISDEAILTIAKLSAGGMRDSLALLDQVSALGGNKKLSETDINNLLGRLSFDTLVELTTTIVNSDPISAIGILDKIYNDGNEPIVILNNLLSHLKNILIAITCDVEKSVELTSLNSAQIEVLSEFKQKLETHQIISLINKVSEYIKEMKQTNHQQMWLEVAIIDLANLTNNTKLEELQRRISALENGSVVTTPDQRVLSPVIQTTVEQRKAVKSAQQETPLNANEVSVSAPEQVVNKKTNIEDSDINELWSRILNNILDVPSRTWLKRQAIPAEITNEKVTLVIQKSDWVDRFNNSERRQIVIDAASLALGNPDIQVIARTPLKNDTAAPLQKEVTEKKKITNPPNIEVEENELEQEEIQIAKTVSTVSDDDSMENSRSDQSKMVKDLFEGKYIV